MTTLKTVSMFLRAAKTDAEEAGESTEGMANSISELREEVLALTGGAVDIQLDENTFKSTYQILQEISKVWHNLTDVSQANLLELLGGKRNSNVVAALLENFTVAEEALATSADSAGSAMAENEKYLDSINGKISIFKASFEELSTNLINSDAVKGVIDIGTGLINFLNSVNSVLEALGGLKTVLIALIPYFAIFNSGIGATAMLSMSKLFSNIKIGISTIVHAIPNAIAAWQSYAAGVVSANTAMQASLPVIGLVLVALTGLVAIADQFITTTEEANEELAKSKTEYQESSDKIKSLNDELQTTNERITELQNKGKLSFTEQEELSKLQQLNQELRTNIDLEQTKLDIAQKQRSNDLIDFHKSYTQTRSNLGLDSFGNVTLISDAEKLQGLYTEYTAQIASGFLEQANQTSTEISNIVSEIINAIDGISYIENPQTELDEKHNAILDSLNKVVLSYNIFAGQEGAKGKALDFLTTNPYKDVTQNLIDLGKAGQVTAETLQDDAYDDFINTAIGMKIISDDSATSLAFLASYFNETGDAAEKAANQFIQASDAVSTLSDIQSMEAGLDQLDKIYGDIYDKEYFDWGSILNNKEFEAAFGKLTEEYNDFITTIANSPNDLTACQSAFNNLATAYLNNSGALRNVTAETRNATIAFLEQQGIANAVSIVDRKLAVDKAKLAYESKISADIALEEANSYLALEPAGSVAQQAIAELILSKISFNNTKIDTSGDIDQIIALANAANASSKALATLERLKQVKAGLDSGSAGALHQLEWYNETVKSIENGTFDYGYQVIDPDQFKVSYSGGSATQSAKDAAAKSQKTQKTWFDKQLAEHKHRVAMEQETDAEYFKWLESAYKKAYNEGIIQLEDYYKYEEEVYNGRKELFKDHLNDKEHEISLLEDYGSQSEKIIDIYEDLIVDVERELADARARGLDSNDDYIQDLESQWQKYYDELFDMFKDHLNDVEHEISMRENYDGESANIIKLYEELKLDVEKEIAKLRAQGYTDEDENIQYLQAQWQNYDKEIRDIRENAADEAKDAINDLVEYRVDMLKQEIQDEKDALNEKLDNLRDFYDKQKEMLQDQYDEEKYLEEQAEKRKSVSDIQSELTMLEFDDSAWAQKRKLELKEELVSAQKELDDFEKDHALDLTLDAIDDAAEAQEKQIEAQMNALDQRLNDPQALYNQALIEIASGTHDIYREMQEYNNKHGSGNPEDIDEKYENAYKALQEYESIYGKSYKGVELNNSTNYSPDKGSWDTAGISGTNPANKTQVSSPALPPSSSSGSSSSSSSSASSSITKGSTVTVKTSATHFGSKSGGVKMASHVPGGTYTVMDISGDQVLIGRNGTATGWVKKSDLNINSSISQSNSSASQTPSLSKGSTVTIKTSATHFGSKSKGVKMASQVPGGTYTVMSISGDQVLIGRNGTATGWVKKSDIVGYAKGTAYAKAGLARIFEEGYEQIFTSVDGNKYKLFNNGDKVLNAKATEFLYDFAESGGAILKAILSHALYGNLPNLNDKIIPTDIHMGDIIIQGNADNNTVSEIRRTQRENIDYILNKFSKLNK